MTETRFAVAERMIASAPCLALRTAATTIRLVALDGDHYRIIARLDDAARVA